MNRPNSIILIFNVTSVLGIFELLVVSMHSTPNNSGLCTVQRKADKVRLDVVGSEVLGQLCGLDTNTDKQVQGIWLCSADTFWLPHRKPKVQD